MHRSTRRSALVLVVAAVLPGCELIPGELYLGTPIAYRSVTIVSGERGALHRHAGLYYALENVSVRRISSLEIEFALYDGEGRALPRPGANVFRVALDTSIDPGAVASFCTSLDEVGADHADALVVARFRVRTVWFDDGSRWRNPGGHVYLEER